MDGHLATGRSVRGTILPSAGLEHQLEKTECVHILPGRTARTGTRNLKGSQGEITRTPA